MASKNKVCRHDKTALCGETPVDRRRGINFLRRLLAPHSAGKASRQLKQREDCSNQCE
ncbi:MULTISPECIES: hypothetical protein [Okeania]|uniref:hypothetical protein n=1 Tax=Okeania TaxID=1458928 RepID=UPI001374B036|nr:MULTISPECIES: hypothetical protein [Okeania]NET12758.1 hypothetical protein [Okeania sp. SIO1H6]NES79546.1 hypothetical protein [Okeania sp. SIO1H4]NES89344.1 hypothetical protein [Okeania sp. SIO2B9]NET23217.1 hypothetical protein [Okeania sp. SIO1H5]NET77959.1 hypothetical protein [Okeania sp. SIO1F9]